MRATLFIATVTVILAQAQTVETTNVGIELQISDLRPYQQTELVPVTLRVLGRPPKPAEAPPPLPQERPTVRWQFGGFLVDPPLANGTDLCGTVSQPCGLRGAGFSGRMDVDFDKISDTSSTVLNDYTGMSIPPGRYRVSALARKLVLTSRGPMSSSYNYPNPPETVVSNTVDLQVVTATPQWIGETIATAAATVQAGGRDYEKTRNAAKQLAFIDTPAAWRVILNLLPAQENVLLAELSSTSQPGPLCDVLQARISVPEQAVTSLYLSAMNSLCSRANVPQPPAPLTTSMALAVGAISAEPVPAGRATQPDAERQAYFERQRAYVEDLTRRSTDTLAASLAGKQNGAPKVESIKALLAHVRQLQYNRPRGAMPGWAAELASAVVNNISAFSAEDRRTVLPLFASTLPTPAAASTFEAILNDWQPDKNPEEVREALKALYKVDPQRAKERIRAEITKELTWLEPPMLQLLPASDVSAMDDTLLDAVKPGVQPSWVLTAAIARYATPQALLRVRAIYDAQTNSCQPELVAYFLRTDEAYARGILRSTATLSCLPQYFQRTAALIMTPTLEEFTASYLMKDAVFIKTEAAKSLGKYGSPKAEEPLWAALRYFHDYWDGKGSELAKNGEGIVLEEQLGVALARGRGWVATDAELKTIQSLCIAERCLYQVGQDLQTWRGPLRLEVFEEAGGIRGAVAQYSGFGTLAEIETKLAQFPKSTSFVMTVSGPSHETIEDSLRRVASREALTLQTR